MLEIRRVVTGHDANGLAVVKFDELTNNAVINRPGAVGAVIWSTEGFPVDNTDDQDGATRELGTSESGGTIFRVVSYEPGVAPRMHRTESMDYAVVVSGAIDMQLDDMEVHLKAGDMLVQRGTIHGWVNRGAVPCVVAFVLIGAKPVRTGGQILGERG